MPARKFPHKNTLHAILYYNRKPGFRKSKLAFIWVMSDLSFYHERMSDSTPTLFCRIASLYCGFRIADCGFERNGRESAIRDPQWNLPHVADGTAYTAYTCHRPGRKLAHHWVIMRHMAGGRVAAGPRAAQEKGREPHSKAVVPVMLRGEASPGAG